MPHFFEDPLETLKNIGCTVSKIDPGVKSEYTASPHLLLLVSSFRVYGVPNFFSDYVDDDDGGITLYLSRFFAPFPVS